MHYVRAARLTFNALRHRPPTWSEQLEMSAWEVRGCMLLAWTQAEIDKFREETGFDA